jgi:hypothetical protein
MAPNCQLTSAVVDLLISYPTHRLLRGVTAAAKIAGQSRGEASKCERGYIYEAYHVSSPHIRQEKKRPSPFKYCAAGPLTLELEQMVSRLGRVRLDAALDAVI